MMDAGKQGQESDTGFIEGSAATNWVSNFSFFFFFVICAN